MLTVYIFDPLFVFDDKSSGASKITWGLDYKGSSIDNSPVASFDSIGCFPITLVAENYTGCLDSVTKEICIQDVYRFFAPNAFTPDNDGVNDLFVTKWHLMDVNEYEFMVFDRWGLLIFETNTPYDYWDGKIQGKSNLVQQDVYVWKAKTKDIYGDNYSYIGTVTVVR